MTETAIAVATAITAIKKQKARKKNDLSMLITTDNIHPWRDRREAEYEAMTNAEKFKEVFGFDGDDDCICCSWWDEKYVSPSDDIQHVGYDSSQLGRDK